MAFVVIEDGEVVGVFARPQQSVAGYAEIADDDPRVAAYNDRPPADVPQG